MSPIIFIATLYVTFRNIRHQLASSFKFQAEMLTKMCSVFVYLSPTATISVPLPVCPNPNGV